MTETIGETLVRFRADNGLDAHARERAVWPAQLGALIVPLPNFRWRRAIIDRHDAHHLITGLSTSAGDELLLAAWELGVGCYKSIWARALCLALTALGAATQPKRTWIIYRTGRDAAENYAATCAHALFILSTDEMRENFACA